MARLNKASSSIAVVYEIINNNNILIIIRTCHMDIVEKKRIGNIVPRRGYVLRLPVRDAVLVFVFHEKLNDVIDSFKTFNN